MAGTNGTGKGNQAGEREELDCRACLEAFTRQSSEIVAGSELLAAFFFLGLFLLLSALALALLLLGFLLGGFLAEYGGYGSEHQAHTEHQTHQSLHFKRFSFGFVTNLSSSVGYHIELQMKGPLTGN
jgi:hypothetical protein